VPVVANGMVFVGTMDGLTVYGLNQPTSVPQTPTLAANSLSGTSVNLTWQDSSQRPNIASEYLIEESTDGVNFTQVTTAAQGTNSLAIGGLSAGTTYYFRIRGLDSQGDSTYSNIVSVTPFSSAPSLNFSGGFANSASQLTYNGSAAVNGNNAEITDGGSGEASSIFTTSAVNIATFQTQFTFQLTAGADTADGFTFCIQGVSPTAVGPYGGGLGYGPDSASQGNSGGIPQSMAVKFDLYSNEGEGNDSTGLYTDGAAPTALGSIDLTTTGINLHSGDVFQVNMGYDGSSLTVTIKDTNTGATATQRYSVNISGLVGGDTAYVGFTGGTGGLTAVQNILTWTFGSTATQAPSTPTALHATPASANTVTLSWTPGSSNQQGYYLDRATDPGFTQNFITEWVPASPSSFTDTASGLTAGGTYYYRLRALNSAGSSVNSAVVSVSIPNFPPAPSNPSVIRVTTNAIDLGWTDNAGALATGYAIYRSSGGGPFTLQAALPPGSTSWQDNNVAPGTSYTYHIVAYNISGSNGYAAISATTPAVASPPSPLALVANVQNVFQELVRLELDALWLGVYSSGGPSYTSKVFALLADILANPLYNTPLGAYALQQALAPSPSSGNAK
jgi:hypothetical protein